MEDNVHTQGQPSRRLSGSLGVAVLTALVMAAFVAPADALGQVFSYTGGEQSYVVPPGVTQVHVVAVGAPGGGAAETMGAVVSGDLPIPAGQVLLFVEVGGSGSSVAQPGRAFNGGGAAFGGGRSDVRLVSLPSPPRSIRG
jgi:hypothetical protein